MSNKPKTPKRGEFRRRTNDAVNEWVQSAPEHRVAINILAEDMSDNYGDDGGNQSMTVGGNQIMLQNALMSAFMAHNQLAEIIGFVVDEYRKRKAEQN